MLRAFTLIELLVVVTIVAVLMALLMPVVGIVRGQAKSVSCMSNQRGIGEALIAWSADNRGLLPYGQGAPSGMAYNWLQAMQELDPKAITTCPGAQIRAGTRHFTANMQVLTDRAFGAAAYKGTHKQVHTVETRSELVMLFDGGQTAGGDAWPMSENMGLTFYYLGNTGLAASQQDDAVLPPATSGTFRIDNRHGSFQRANYLFADGHVRNVRMADLTNGDFRINANGRRYY